MVLLKSLIQNTWGWALFPQMTPRFADLRMVTRTADCVAEGGWSMASDSCDLWARQYNYPPLWAWGFSLLNLGESRTELAGVILGALVIGAVVCMGWVVALQSDSWWGFVAVLAASASPPIAILIERGNTDSIVFLLIVTAALFAAKSRVVSIVVSSVAAGLKVFPAIAFWHFYAKRKTWWEPALFASLTLFLLVPTLRYLPLISQRTPYTSEYSYGASVTMSVFWPEVLEVERFLYAPLNLVVTLLAGVLLFGLLGKSLRAALSDFKSRENSFALLQLAGLAFLGAYLSGTRFDYSLTFLIPVVVVTALTNSRNFSLVVLQTLVLISMWGTHFGRDVPNVRNPVSDVAAGLTAALIVALQIADLVELRRRAVETTP